MNVIGVKPAVKGGVVLDQCLKEKKPSAIYYKKVKPAFTSDDSSMTHPRVCAPLHPFLFILTRTVRLRQNITHNGNIYCGIVVRTVYFIPE